MLNSFISIILWTSLFAENKAFQSQEITIVSEAPEPTGSCTIGATLTKPKQDVKALALIIHGSGAQDRNGTTQGGFAPYRDIAETLSSHGVAVIRYDKRSSIQDCAQRMNHPQFRHTVFVQDAVQVLEHAQNLPELIGKPTFLIGHSQGGNFATDIALRYPQKVHGLVLLAGLGHYAIDTTLMRQLRDQLKNPSLSDEQKTQIQQLISQGETFFEKVRSGNYREEDFFFGAFAPFWDDYIQFTERASEIAELAAKPTMVMQGSFDSNITREDYVALVEATEKTQGSSSLWVEGAHHLLAIPPETQVSQAFLRTMVDWVMGISS
jgi:pimeloyl-ACP methyl ester carboxylesterase